MLLFDSLLYSVIQIDLMTNSINFYKCLENGKGETLLKTEHFSSKFGEEEFFETLKGAISINYNKKTDGKTALILPDELFFIDNIRLPLIQKKAMENSLNLALSALYDNLNELKFSSFILNSDKKNATYLTIGVKKDILDKIVSTVQSCGVDLSAVTFSANSTISGVIQSYPKIKNSDFIFADVKPTYTRICLAVKGKTAGYMSVPIGSNCFSERHITREYEHFDHSEAESVVELAKAKAKNKKIAIIKAIETSEDGELSTTTGEEETIELSSQTGKPLKRYPKFMVRETPETAEGVKYENFRPILKWIEEVIVANEDILTDKKETPIYINLPKGYEYLIEKGNNEVGVERYKSIEAEGEKQGDTQKIDLYGGIYLKKPPKPHLF